MIVCPGCRRPAEANTWPFISMDTDAARPDPVDWWCPDCLRRRLVEAHAVPCRCEGCARRRSDEEWSA